MITSTQLKKGKVYKCNGSMKELFIYLGKSCSDNIKDHHIYLIQDNDDEVDIIGSHEEYPFFPGERFEEIKISSDSVKRLVEAINL